MRCVILQPSYIPWRGYFDQINQADVFVFYDDVKYDKNGWRNRNRIKTPQGVIWLTIPVHTKRLSTENIPIDQIQIAWQQPWNRKHWMTLQQVYRKAPYFNLYAPLLEDFYSREPEYLSEFNIDLTIALSKELGISGTEFVRSSSLKVNGTKTDRLIQILTRLGVDDYLTGPSAQSYIEEDKFEAAGISLSYMVYDYPEYPQLYPPYDPYVSILDLMFMTGPDALCYIVKK
jgi:hypothetical protein